MTRRGCKWLFDWQKTQNRKKQAAEDKERLPMIVWLVENPKTEASHRWQGEGGNDHLISQKPDKERSKKIDKLSV